MKMLFFPAALLFSIAVSGQDTAKRSNKAAINVSTPVETGLSVEEIETLYPEAITWTTKNVAFGKNTYRTIKEKTVNTEKLVKILAALLREQQIELTQVKRQLEAFRAKSSGK